MSEKDGPEKLNVQIEQWEPRTPEADQEFFKRTVPELRSLKARHLNDLFPDGFPSGDHVEVRLDYLERRLHALKPGDVVYIGRSGEHVVACILVRWDEQEKRTKIEQFYVDPIMRSQGIGSTILEKAFEHARQTHSDVSQGIFLSTVKGEENRARQLYERMGFRVSSLPGDLPEEIRFNLDFKEA